MDDLMDKIKYFIIRTYLYILFLLFFLTGGLLPLILMPVYKHAFAPHLRYKDIKASVFFLYAYKIMWRSLTDKNYRDTFAVKMTSPPRLDTDTHFIRVKQSWGGGHGDCDLCEAACCAVLKCPFLDENHRCLSYGSLFFVYFHCGRFPETQKQIDYYQCPKWETS